MEKNDFLNTDLAVVMEFALKKNKTTTTTKKQSTNAVWISISMQPIAKLKQHDTNFTDQEIVS